MTDPTPTERTDQGDQYLVPDVRPVTVAEHLARYWDAPMQPRRAKQQRPCNIGLFDEDARNQGSLF
jgi:hypothetical protein